MKSAMYPLAVGALTLVAIGCGTNQFQQELQIEASAVKLARETASADYELITTEELNELLAGDDDILLVDAMPHDASFAREHIPGAVNFEFPKEVMDQWDDSQTAGESLDDYEAFLGEDKNRRIVVYCGFVKCARSHNAGVFAQQLGYTDVVRYAGGIYAWKGAGNSLEAE